MTTPSNVINSLTSLPPTEPSPFPTNIAFSKLAQTLIPNLTMTDSLELQNKVCQIALTKIQTGDLSLLLQHQPELSQLRDARGRTLLMQATAGWEKEIVEQLTRYNIGIHEIDETGNTALHHAAAHGALHVLNVLTQYLGIQTPNHNHQTPLHVAILNGQAQVARFLVKKGANTQTTCHYQKLTLSALPLAVLQGNTDCVDALMESSRVNLKEMTPGIGTLLHMAVTFHQIDLLKHLFKNYPSEFKPLLEIPDENHLTPFSLAAKLGNIEALILLKEQGANLKCPDDQQRGPLHQAVMGMQLEALSWLLYLGCDLSQLDLEHNTATGLAKELATKYPNNSTVQSIANQLKNNALQDTFEKPSWIKTSYENLVFQSSGDKSSACVGGLKYLHEKNLLKDIQRVAGTSSGAITALLVATNTPVDELEEVLTSINLTLFLDPSLSSKSLEEACKESTHIERLKTAYLSIQEGAHPKELAYNLYIAGIFSEEKLIHWLEEKIYEKTMIPNCTFRELREKLVKENRGKHLHIFATKVGTQKEPVRFNSEDKRWDDLVISHAIFASLLVPWVYSPHILRFKDRHTGSVYERTDLGSYVDGGLVCHFPIDAFDEKRYQQTENKDKQQSQEAQFNRHTLGFSFKTSNKKQSVEVKEVLTVGELIKNFTELYYNSDELILKRNPNNTERVVELEVSRGDTGREAVDQKSMFQSAYEKTKSQLDDKLKLPEEDIPFKLLKAQGKLHLPQVIETFTGRINLLEQLYQGCAFEDWNSRKQAVLLLHGLAGLGKSETALEFAKRHIERFSLIWHIPSEDSFLYDEAYRLLAKTLNIPFEKEPPEAIRRKVHFYLENTQEEKPWLLIFDNVENELPIPARGGVILITSRHQQLGALQALRIGIQPFDKEESKEFLLKHLTSDQLDDLDALHQALGGWPLLLTQVAMYLKGTSDKVSQYLKELEGIDPVFTRDEQVRYPRSLGQAFDLTLQKLSQNNPLALGLLCCCAFLNPDQTDIELFHRWMGGTPLKWKRKCLEPLRDLSILKLSQGKTGFGIHRLWQFFLRIKMKEKGVARVYFEKVVELLFHAAQKFDYNKLKTWNQWKVCVPHVDVDGEYWEQIEVEKRSKLLTQAGLFFLNVQGNPEKALQYLQKALEINKKAFGENHPDTGTSYNNVGLSFINLGQHPKSLEYLQKALVIWTKTLGKSHPYIVTSYNNMGGSFINLGQHAKSLKYIQRTLEINKKMLGENHPDTGQSYNNVGMSFSALGRHVKALEYLQKALEIRIKALGEDHPLTGASYNNVGMSLSDLDRHVEALEYKQKALEIRIKALGENHPDTGASYNNVGMSLSDLDRHVEALEYKQKALVIWKKALGEDHPHTGISYDNVGSSFSDLDRHVEALEYKQKALEIRIKALGKDHPYTGTSYNNVGMSLSDLDRNVEALEYFQKALEVRIKALDKNHPDIGESYNKIGMSFSAQGQHDEALIYKQKALVIWKKALGKDHPQTGISYDNVGYSFSDLDRHAEALEYFQKALEIKVKALGEDHLETGESYKNMGLSFRDLGRYAEALEYLQKALDIWKKSLGDGHPLTLESANNVEYCKLKLSTQSLHPQENTSPSSEEEIQIDLTIKGEPL
jgi:tetratricopeptide (TPR) repeat protein/ankyrin repeat protein/predicted acylesterase/phospholipase RssA